MAEKKIKKLTQIQRETLDSLRDGGMITVDAHNFPWLGDRALLPSIRYFLTENGLVTRLDKSRQVGAKGNGLVISEKGLSVLAQQPPNRKTKSETVANKAQDKPTTPTERQLAFANDLGIDVPSNATSDEVSDLISARVDEDLPANERQRSIAVLYGVKFTQFTGKRQLATRILNAVKRPSHDNDLAAWFTYRVYRYLIRGPDDIPIIGPDHPTIKEIAVQLAADQAVLSSVRRYDAQDLRRFGQWTAPDGALCTGGSKRTAAYEKATALLEDKLGVGD